MSLLRNESLRLCWLEAFIAVADLENISEAARSLGIDQSSVSRYMQDLEEWLGKKLVEPGRVVDTQDARLSIGITDDGHEFYIVAERVLKDLLGIRSKNAAGSEILRRMEKMVCIMEKDGNSKPALPVYITVKENIVAFRNMLSNIDNEYPIDFLEALHEEMRAFYQRYEQEIKREKRMNRKKPTSSGAKIKVP